MNIRRPFSLKGWIEDHRELLKPPVGNQLVYEDTDFMVMIVGGPNRRHDFHVNPTEEFFYQIEGDISLRMATGGTFEDVPIKEGEIFLLPPLVPHSPQRGEHTVGLVMERKRPEGAHDGFQWYCRECKHLLHEEFFPLLDIVKQLPPLFEKFYGDSTLTTCSQCQTVESRDVDWPPLS